MTEPRRPHAGGYGNIYTPHAGSMIIQVQRESGLANRTIVLSQRQVRLLRLALHLGGALLVLGTTSWLFLASQAARVPSLTRRVTALQHDVRRLDTLQTALTALERRFRHVQQMLGAPAPVTQPASNPLPTQLAPAGKDAPPTPPPPPRSAGEAGDPHPRR